jgi:hypothetical protein
MRAIVYSLISFALAAGASAAPAPPEAEKAIADIAALWTGQFDNARHVRQSLAWGDPAAPELTREARMLRVERLDAPQLGETVIYFEEERASQPGLSHRQRVVSLVWDAKAGKVRAQQLFFSEILSYDRKPKPAAEVARLPASAFHRQPACDLFFTYEETWGRWRGAMARRSCVYDHPGSGRVYADFEQLLYPNQHWYRDRSHFVKGDAVRGEIDGFSWLLFDRIDAAPNAGALHPLLQQAGVWRGTFSRFNAKGELEERFPSEITVTVGKPADPRAYVQVNRYTRAGGKVEELHAEGRIEGNRITFKSPQIDGFSSPIADDPTRRTAFLYAKFLNGSGLEMFELITLAPDGKSRVRDTQFLRGGELVRRTLIDETWSEK